MRYVLAAGVLVLLAGLAFGQTFYVSADGTGDYGTIQAAVNAAVEGDVVVLEPGIYKGDGNRDIDFLGKAITVSGTEPNDWSVVEATVIDCNGSKSHPHRGFYYHSGEDANSVLTGVTVTGGFAARYNEGMDDHYDNYAGGGILCVNSAPTVSRCAIIYNNLRAYSAADHEEDEGGGYDAGIWDELPSLPGHRMMYGGGICLINSDCQIQDCLISYNESSIGGGICILEGNAVVSSCEIKANYATLYDIWNLQGGGIYSEGEGVQIIDCLIRDNKAGVEYFGSIMFGSGGGVYIQDGLIEGCRILFNNAQTGGGIVCCGGKVRKNIICSNYGAGGNTVLFGGGDGALENCLISNNRDSAAWGSGSTVSCSSSSNVTIRNCTIADNIFSVCGIKSFSPNLFIVNSILRANAESGGVEIGLFRGTETRATADIRYCVVAKGEGAVTYQEGCELIWGAGNIDCDPCFVDSGYWDPNGTPTDANDDFWVEGSDYHLKSAGWRWDGVRGFWDYDDVTSRCIDAGAPGVGLGEELMSVPDDPWNEWGENVRINMGAYGGTAEASMGPHGWSKLSDMTNDGVVGPADMEVLSGDWLKESESYTHGERPPIEVLLGPAGADLNRDGVVDMRDFAVLAGEWGYSPEYDGGGGDFGGSPENWESLPSWEGIDWEDFLGNLWVLLK